MMLVTGATGKVGGEVVRLLREQGAPVRVLIRDPTRVAQWAELGVDAVVGDLQLPGTLEIALAGAHRALLVSSPDPRQAEFHGNFIRVASRRSLELLIRVSVRGARAESGVGLVRWHAASEQQLAESLIPHVNLRPAGFMQNLVSSGPIIQEGRLVSCRGARPSAMVDARDVAAVAVALATGSTANLPQALDVTGPESLHGQDVADILARVLGQPVQHVEVLPLHLREALIGNGMPEWLAADLVAFSLEENDHDADVSDAVHALTGRSPRSLEQFVREHRDLFIR